MNLTYGDIPLSITTTEHKLWAESHIDVKDCVQFNYQAFPGKNLTKISFPVNFWMPKKIKLGCLSWYRGASRYAHYFGLATSNQLEQITAQISNPVNPLILNMETNNGEIKTEMYLLPYRPLTGPFNNSNSLYLLTLVDIRYFWWMTPSPYLFLQCPNKTTTWTTVFQKYSTALGINIAVDAISPNYLMPHKNLDHPNESIPPLLDAIAFNVGQYIVRDLAGNVRSMNAANGIQLLNNNLALAEKHTFAGGKVLTPQN